ncbi:MAG: Maf family protein [Archangium sp.]|nr:Maf family protein [Archangium sp.]
MKLTLASASPRRRELLSHLGVAFEVAPADLDESLIPGEHAASYVERLARAKARGPGLILAADTSVVIDDEVLGKPGTDPILGATMLRRLSGRAHQVMTGIAVSGPTGLNSRVVVSEVHFRKLSNHEIDWYVGTGEGADKAGGYALQGRAGAFITSIVGSPSNVIGLPLAETVGLLRAAGLRLPMDGP